MNTLLLVVEDEPVLRISLVRGLSKLPGVTAVGAGTIAEALEIIDKEPPQLLVSDIDLPDGTGLELVSVLDQKSLNIPVIYASAYVEKFRVHIPNRTNVTVLEKPVPLALIRKLVIDKLDVALQPGAEGAPFDTTDYLQLACMCRKSVEIVVLAAGRELGHVVVRDGEIWAAQKGALGGEQALRDLLFAPDTIARCIAIRGAEDERTIHQSWESILLEAARLHDEARASTYGALDEEGPVTLEFGAVDESTQATIPPPSEVKSRPSSEPEIELEYVKRERRLREYEESQYPEGGAEPRSDPTPGPTNYVHVRFSELYEEGIDALLSRDYHRALEKFTECHDLVPTDSRVVANLARLEQLGYTMGDE